LDAAGSLYGATFYGGTKNSTCTFGCGIVYRIDKSGKYAVLHRFTGGADGWIPTGSLTEDSAGNIYGTSTVGGSGNSGVVFKITP
jgi:uncharacterized repeat protein (TIGR03803 family)